MCSDLSRRRKTLVVSAVNLVEGGTLEILRNCLKQASQLEGWRVIALVHSKSLIEIPGIKYVELPKVKRSWFIRLYFEYCLCRKLAQRIKPKYWLSLHDTSPFLGKSVVPVKQSVYCHNALCFYRFSLREALLDPKQFILALCYKAIYRINLRNNDKVIVQQQWIREEFKRIFGLSDVIVAYPHEMQANDCATKRIGKKFIYPSFPRTFKNFEVLLNAWEILVKDPNWEGELTVTFDATSNAYARALFGRFGGLRGVNFAGVLPKRQLEELYLSHDCLVFPSKLETWGLPITEAKDKGLMILAADFPFTREAVGNYDGCVFFDFDDVRRLSELMREYSEGCLQNCRTTFEKPDHLFAENWYTLFGILLK